MERRPSTMSGSARPRAGTGRRSVLRGRAAVATAQPHQMPTTVGPEPRRSRARRRPPARVQRVADHGAQRHAPRARRSLTSSRSGSPRVRSQRRDELLVDASNSASARCRPRRSASRYTSGVASAKPLRRSPERRARRAAPVARSVSPAPVPSDGPGQQLARHVRAQPDRDLIDRLRAAREPAAVASRSIAAASAEPPPIPAATGIRLSIVDRHRRAAHPVARSAASASRGEVGTLDPCAYDLIAHVRRSLTIELVRQPTATRTRSPAVAAVGASRPRNRQRFILA